MVAVADVTHPGPNNARHGLPFSIAAATYRNSLNLMKYVTTSKAASHSILFSIATATNRFSYSLIKYVATSKAAKDQ